MGRAPDYQRKTEKRVPGSWIIQCDFGGRLIRIPGRKPQRHPRRPGKSLRKGKNRLPLRGWEKGWQQQDVPGIDKRDLGRDLEQRGAGSGHLKPDVF